MNIQLNLDDDQADAIVRQQLEMNISLLREEKTRLAAMKKRTKAQDRDLADANLYLIALVNAYEYYGGNIE